MMNVPIRAGGTIEAFEPVGLLCRVIASSCLIERFRQAFVGEAQMP